MSKISKMNTDNIISNIGEAADIDVTEIIEISADENCKDKRIDVLLAETMNVTRSSAQKMIETGKITVNGIKKEKNYKARTGDVIKALVTAPKAPNIIPQNLELDVLYEDSDVIVINKRQGMTVHPSQENYTDTLVNALLYKCKGSLSGINGEARPGIVHRLDKYTSGVMIAAKNDRAHISLAEQIKAHSVERIYNAVVAGNIKSDSGTLNFPLGRSKKDFRKIAVYKNTDEANKIKSAVTHYEVIGRYTYAQRSYTHLKIQLETGRTHQIRVHMAHTGHPVIGDATYGNADVNRFFPFLAGQCLHSKSIRFVHPVTQKEIYIETQLPVYFERVMCMIDK